MARPMSTTPSLHVLLLTTGEGADTATSVMYIAATRTEINNRVAAMAASSGRTLLGYGDGAWRYGDDAYLRTTETGLLSPQLARALGAKPEAPL